MPRRAIATVMATVLALVGACADPTAPGGGLAGAGAPAADRQAALPGGRLSLCKQAGAGLTTGTPFTFGVSSGGVARSVSVATGSCVALDVPRESAALSKGYYRNTADAITRLLPAGATLLVGDALLSSAQVQAVLDGGANVSASSALLLNLAQQLIAADLNVLRGVQPPADVAQAIADANTALHVGVGAGGVQLTSALTTAQLGVLVDLLADFDDGKTKPGASPASATLQIVETASAHVTVASIACAPALQCTNADAATRSVTAIVASGATTTVTYTNAAQPVLRVCKVAGPGVAPGTVYHVSAVLLASASGSASFDVPAGDCRDAVVAPGSYAVQETLPAGVAASAIECAPAERCGTPKLADAFVIAAVVDASTTTVTYTNRSTLGTLRVCKAAGAGIAPGTAFHFSAVRLGLGSDQASLDVPAGECRDVVVREGPYALSETKSTGIAVTAIDCAPAAACESAKLADGFVIPTVTATSTVTVTYTNRSTLGTLRVCTIVGSGFAPGTAFHVSATRLGIPSFAAGVDVPAGGCGETAVLEGTYAVQESVAGFAVAGITCDPATSCESANVGAGFIIGTVAAQSTLTVTYVNSTAAMLRVPSSARSSP